MTHRSLSLSLSDCSAFVQLPVWTLMIQLHKLAWKFRCLVVVLGKGKFCFCVFFFLLKAEQVNHFSFNHHPHTQWAQCQTLRKKPPKYVTLNLYAAVLPVHLKKLRVQTKQNQWHTKTTHTHSYKHFICNMHTLMDILEALHISAGLRTYWCSPRRGGGRGRAGCLCLDSCLHHPDWDKWHSMDGLMHSFFPGCPN